MPNTKPNLLLRPATMVKRVGWLLAILMILAGMAGSYAKELNFYTDYLTGKRPIRVAILCGVEEVKLVGEGYFLLLDAPSGNKILTFSQEGCTISLKTPTKSWDQAPSSDSEESSKLKPYFEIDCPSKEETLTWNNDLRIVPLANNNLISVLRPGMKYRCTPRFRGSLELKINQGNRFAVINELKLEEYLHGVVPKEISRYTPKEGLKAQAIVCRTHTLYSLGKHQTQGFDLCIDEHCQLYGGYNAESAECNNIIDETKGRVIIYKGNLLDTTYHAVCGGVTECSQNVWNGVNPLLSGVWDAPEKNNDALSEEKGVENFLSSSSSSFCKGSSRFRWSITYTREELEKMFCRSLPVILRHKDVSVGIIQSVKVLQRSASGRVQVLEIKGSEGTYQVQKDEIRWLFGRGKAGGEGLPSTLFLIKPQSDSEGIPTRFIFIGGGWGHGVGMCQSGAQVMAKLGYKCEEILRHYYSGAEIYHP